MLNLEHETKTLISREDFKKLFDKYNLNQPIIQRNIYLETRDQYYKHSQGALRLRAYNEERYEITLKLKNGSSHAEYNMDLTEGEFTNILNSNVLPEFSVPLELKKPDLQFTIKTKRYKLPFKNYIIEIDESCFEQSTDYEIEIEAESITKAYELLEEFLNENNLPYTASESKIARYFQYNPLV